MCIFLLINTHSMNMKGLVVLIIVTLALMLVLTYPFKLKANTHIDVFNNVGFVACKIAGIKVLCLKFKLRQDGKFDIERNKKKRKKKKNKTLSHYYFKTLASRVHFKKIDIIIDIGIKDEVLGSTMVSGYIGVFLSAITACLLNNNKHLRVFNSVLPCYEKDVIEFTGLGVISFSLADMMISILHAYVEYKDYKRRVKNA